MESKAVLVAGKTPPDSNPAKLVRMTAEGMEEEVVVGDAVTDS